MSILWIHALHVVAAVLWVAGLTGVLALLQVMPRLEASGRDAAVRAGRALALAMDLGAAAAIGLGLYRAFAFTPNAFKTGGWLHVKLTAVVLGVLAAHGIARARLARARRGEVKPLPAFAWALLVAGAAAAIVLGSHKMLMRG